jgi:hypothetical protein
MINKELELLLKNYNYPLAQSAPQEITRVPMITAGSHHIWDRKHSDAKDKLESAIEKIVLQSYKDKKTTAENSSLYGLDRLMFIIFTHDHGKRDEEVAEITSILLDLGAKSFMKLESHTVSCVLQAIYRGYTKTAELLLSKGCYSSVFDINTFSHLLEESKIKTQEMLSKTQELDIFLSSTEASAEKQFVRFIEEGKNSNFYLCKRILSHMGLRSSIEQNAFLKVMNLYKGENNLELEHCFSALHFCKNFSLQNSKFPFQMIFKIEKLMEKSAMSLKEALDLIIQLSHLKNEESIGSEMSKYMIDLLIQRNLPEEVIEIITSHDKNLSALYQKLKEETIASKKAEAEKEKQRAEEKEKYDKFMAQSVDEIIENYKLLQIEEAELHAVERAHPSAKAFSKDILTPPRNIASPSEMQLEYCYPSHLDKETKIKLHYLSHTRYIEQNINSTKSSIESGILSRINDCIRQGENYATPLLKISREGNYVALKYIIDNLIATDRMECIAIDLKDALANTALYYLISHGLIDYAKILIEHNANPYELCAEGVTPYVLSETKGYNDLCELMKEKYIAPIPTTEVQQNHTEQYHDSDEDNTSSITAPSNILGLNDLDIANLADFLGDITENGENFG